MPLYYPTSLSIDPHYSEGIFDYFGGNNCLSCRRISTQRGRCNLPLASIYVKLEEINISVKTTLNLLYLLTFNRGKKKSRQAVVQSGKRTWNFVYEVENHPWPKIEDWGPKQHIKDWWALIKKIQVEKMWYVVIKYVIYNQHFLGN